MEFDNEIDALLRKARDDRGVLVGDTGKLHLHLDADEIAAFAENAVPDPTRQAYVAHFADCDGCRKTLSSVILLNSEAELETASVVSAPVVAETKVPWYRKLFLFPNLAYVMGSLVLLFSGFLAFSILRNPGESVSSEVSQISMEEPAASGPNLGFDDTYSNANTAAANTMSSAANTAANAASNPANPANARSPAFAANTALGNAASTDTTSPAPTERLVANDEVRAGAPLPKDVPVTMADRDVLAKAEEQRNVPAKESEKPRQELKAVRETSPPVAGGPSKAMKGPSRNDRSDARMGENNLRAKRSTKPETSMTANRKEVVGKTFELKQGVWYDSAYRGQGTTNVRRGTNDYKKLDSGLRSIADSIAGTVVVVWKEAAYRIQ